MMMVISILGIPNLNTVAYYSIEGVLRAARQLLSNAVQRRTTQHSSAPQHTVLCRR